MVNAENTPCWFLFKVCKCLNTRLDFYLFIVLIHDYIVTEVDDVLIESCISSKRQQIFVDQDPVN